MKKILVASCWAPHDGQGIGSLSTDLAVELRRRGHEVAYFAPPAENSVWGTEFGIDLIHSQPDFRVDQIERAFSKILEFDPDVVFNNDNPFMQSLFPRIERAVRISICHAMSWGTFRLAVYNWQYTDAIVALSKDMVAKLTRSGIPISRIVLVHNGVPDAGFSDKLLESKSVRLRALFAGPWTRLKGSGQMKKLFAAAALGDRGHLLDVALFGSIAPRVRSQLEKFEFVTIHGRVGRTEFLKRLGNSEVLLFPSLSEGCPMTVIEAMSFGVIPIVTNSEGAMDEIVVHGENGFVVDPSDWDSEVLGILESLCNDSKYKNAIRLSARATYERCLKIEISVQKLMGVSGRALDDFGRNTSPTVNMLKWHRQHKRMGPLASLFAKLFYRLGVLRHYRLKL